MNDIPVLQVRGKTLASAYENAILAVYRDGCHIKTQYDKPEDPPSKDCTLNLIVEQPACDPMIHKAFPGGIADLREYVYELHGLKDEWVKNINDPKDTRWEYTYHGRLTRYGAWKQIFKDSFFYEKNAPLRSYWSDGKTVNLNKTSIVGIDQISWVVDKLVKQPYTRQAQMITWMPNLDMECYDPPCLQSIWLRIVEDGNDWVLNTNIRFRSNDAWGASFMNMFGLTQLIKTIATEISVKTGKLVHIGRLNWQADSYHIYGKDIKTCKEMLINKVEAGQPFEKRVWNFHDESIREMYEECEPAILQKCKETEAKWKSE